MSRIFLPGSLFILALIGAHSSAAQDHGHALQQLIVGQQREKRDLGVQDVYKLLFQVHLGIGHMLPDSVSAVRYLERELASLDTTLRGEALVERISTDGDVVRINLRPMAARGISPQLLVRVMLASDRAWRPDTAGFQNAWGEFVSLCREGALTFSRDEVDRWDKRIRGHILEPVHHSEPYTRSNRPAYRVVRRSQWEQAWHDGTP